MLVLLGGLCFFWLGVDCGLVVLVLLCWLRLLLFVILNVWFVGLVVLHLAFVAM